MSVPHRPWRILPVLACCAGTVLLLASVGRPGPLSAAPPAKRPPATAPATREVVEKYRDGKPQVRYRTDAQGRREGPYEEFYPDGKPRVRGAFAAGLKTGTWTSYYPGGKVAETANYRGGLLEGPYAWNASEGKAALRGSCRRGGFVGPVTVLDEQGHVARQPRYLRPLGEVRETCGTLYPRDLQPPKFSQPPVLEPPYKAGALAPQTLEEAVKMARLYRYLSGVPWQNLQLDPKACQKSQHGAVLLNKVGHLTHTPSKPPDFDEAFFALGYAGCKEANLSMGRPDVIASLRGQMDDSDASNIGKVGHRQWLLYPGLQRIGFGFANSYCSVHVNERRQRAVKYDFIAFPGEGYYPLQLVERHYAWSVHVPYARGDEAPAAGALKARVIALDEHFQPAGEVPTSVVSVDVNEWLGWAVIIIKPEWKESGPAEFGPGKCWVELFGLKGQKGKPRKLGYVVDLVDVPEIPPHPEPWPLRGAAVVG